MQNNQSQFDGKVSELIGYQILAWALTTFTLGLATPWAIVMLKKYELEHTVADGVRLRFDGKGEDLFLKWIIWLLLTFITFGIYGFWLNYNLMRWIAENTHLNMSSVVNNTTSTSDIPANYAQDSVNFR